MSDGKGGPTNSSRSVSRMIFGRNVAGQKFIEWLRIGHKNDSSCVRQLDGKRIVSAKLHVDVFGADLGCLDAAGKLIKKIGEWRVAPELPIRKCFGSGKTNRQPIVQSETIRVQEKLTRIRTDRDLACQANALSGGQG